MRFARRRRVVGLTVVLVLAAAALALRVRAGSGLPRRSGVGDGTSVDRVVIAKGAHTLTLLSHGTVVRTYRVALGRGAGPKQQQGDARTPEGLYLVDGKNPHSRFHLALHLSYPNAADRARAASLDVNPGSDVEIHGPPVGTGPLGRLQHMADWTAGCIALSDREVDEVYRLVPVGTPVEISP